jgi:hypothetical protein
MRFSAVLMQKASADPEEDEGAEVQDQLEAVGVR